MGFLQNTWVRYVDRTYQQIKAQVLTGMQSRVPEITDHTDSNIFVKLLDIWSGIAEMLGYYTDNAAREAFIDSCRQYKSAVAIAKLLDYRIRSYIPASADLKFTIDAVSITNIVIPIGTEVQTSEGVSFRTTQTATILAGQTTVTVPASQIVPISGVSLGNSNGTANQEIIIPDTVADGSVVLRVNSLAWAGRQTFGFSIPTDQHFVQTVNKDRDVIVRFGSGTNGQIPIVGQPIDVDYNQTLGVGGNVGAHTITNIISSISLPIGINISVTNTERASGGSDIESLDQLKRHIPLSFRTLERAVTPNDYKDVAELAAGVALAGVFFNCGKTADIYIVPDGGGIASGALLNSTQLWMDDRKMITSFVRTFAAGEVRLLLTIQLQVKPNYSNAAVSAAVQSNLATFVSYLNQEINGTVQLSDIYQVIENTEGVQYSNIVGMTPVPYARPTSPTVPVLNWARQIQPTSNSTINWSIKFVNSTDYQLTKGNVYMGTFSVGAAYADSDIVFTVNAGAYTINDEWVFFTYPYHGTLQLSEPSLPVSLPSDISINATGGL